MGNPDLERQIASLKKALEAETVVFSAKSKAAAEKALQLDNALAEAHCALGVALENFFD